MKNFFSEQADGYRTSIEKGIRAVRRMDTRISRGQGTKEEQLARLRAALDRADAVVIGAGAGLSTSAGFTYSGDRFQRVFFDFAERFGIEDMYSGGFYPFPDAETRWAWWARHIYFNRYIPAPKDVYGMLHALVRDRDSFVITTNVDHQFQRAGFSKSRLFYTQGDYGLFQSVDPADRKTYDNEAWVMAAMEAQGFVRDESGVFQVPEHGKLSMRIPSALVPHTPSGANVKMNLRADDSFVEDEGWHRASAAYAEYLEKHRDLSVLYLELGVGANTPVIIKYPFWQMTAENPKAVYACVNYNEAYCPAQIEKQSICIDGDIGDILSKLK
ncbi:MAG: hypothetical protein II727_02715 [Oscillospiraceae bacterium]|nr:hypothetical protein [Oscillospiraceae bacterium]